MATNNATNTSNPVTVAQGGTGVATNTAYTVICAGTTSTGVLQNVSGVGTSGQILTSNGASALPTWQTGGGATGPGSSTTRAIATWSGTGGTALLNNSKVTISSGSMLTNTGQSAFSYNLASATSNNVTGDGTIYTILPATNVFDQNSDFNSGTGTFTAPVTGRYQFNFSALLANLGSGHTLGQAQVVTTSRTFYTAYLNPFVAASSTFFMVNGSILASMTAADTAYFTVIVTGSTKTVGVDGGNNTSQFCYITGYLVC